MAFYDRIAKDISWEYTSNTDAYLRVVNGKLQLPQPGWLQYHLKFLDNVIEAIDAFRHGLLRGTPYDMSQLLKTVVTDPNEGILWLGQLQSSVLFSIDIESDNLYTDKTRNKVLCIGMAYSPTQAVSFERNCFLDDNFRKVFIKFVANDSHKFILHNGIFDRSRTDLFEDIKLKISEDTMLMHYCGINEHKGTHGLKELAELYLGFPEWEKPLDNWKYQYCRTNRIKIKDFQYSYFPRKMLCEYNCIDVCATFQLYQVLQKLMRPETINIYKKLVEASEYYSNMIVRGMRLNEAYWFELCDKLEKIEYDLEDYFDAVAPGINMASPIQLKALLTKHFPNTIIESTDKEALEDLQEMYPDNELLNNIMVYRKNSKYLKTYVNGLWEHADANKIIHCEFKLHGTETGRLSSANPNMQNIPRNSEIKRLFIAHEGYTLLQLDYSQSELRVLAYISGDQKLMQCYIDGRDLHTEMAKQLFGDNYDPENKDQRVIAKTINFGIPYGRTAGGMSRKLHLPMSEARRYLDNWFKGAPQVKTFIDKCHADALAEPQRVYTTCFGRSRRYYVTSDSVYHVRNQSVNFPISSTANDLTIYSLVEICKWLKEQKFDAYPVNTVHDSIIIECHEQDAKVIAHKCQEIMAAIPAQYLPNVQLPFKADAEIGECYGDLAEPDWEGDDEEDEDEN